MAQTIPERFAWAVETLDPRPDDRVLEIGCGAGLAVSRLCERLRGGRVTALDRSAAMIEKAERRNRAHVEAGRAVFRRAALAEADFGGERFHRAFAFNVNLFWQGPARRELEVLGEALAPGGALFLFFQPPPGSPLRPVAERAAAVLREQGWNVTDVRINEAGPVRSACVVATPLRADATATR